MIRKSLFGLILGSTLLSLSLVHSQNVVSFSIRDTEKDVQNEQISNVRNQETFNTSYHTNSRNVIPLGFVENFFTVGATLVITIGTFYGLVHLVSTNVPPHKAVIVTRRGLPPTNEQNDLIETPFSSLFRLKGFFAYKGSITLFESDHIDYYDLRSFYLNLDVTNPPAKSKDKWRVFWYISLYLRINNVLQYHSEIGSNDITKIHNELHSVLSGRLRSVIQQYTFEELEHSDTFEELLGLQILNNGTISSSTKTGKAIVSTLNRMGLALTAPFIEMRGIDTDQTLTQLQQERSQKERELNLEDLRNELLQKQVSERKAIAKKAGISFEYLNYILEELPAAKEVAKHSDDLPQILRRLRNVLN